MASCSLNDQAAIGRIGHPIRSRTGRLVSLTVTPAIAPSSGTLSSEDGAAIVVVLHLPRRRSMALSPMAQRATMRPMPLEGRGPPMDSFVAAFPFAVGLFAGMLVCLELGRRLGIRRLAKDPEGAMVGLGAIEGAVFALYGPARLAALIFISSRPRSLVAHHQRVGNRSSRLTSRRCSCRLAWLTCWPGLSGGAVRRGENSIDDVLDTRHPRRRWS
jgi:hypothetical protein